MFRTAIVIRNLAMGVRPLSCSAGHQTVLGYDLVWALLPGPCSPDQRYGGWKISSCVESAWKCRSARIKHSGWKLLPVGVHWLWNQIDRARVVTESEKRGIHVLPVVIWGQWTCILFVELVPHAVISDCGQFNMLFCASGMAWSRLLF